MEFASERFHAFCFRDLHFLLDIERTLIYRLSEMAYAAYWELARGGARVGGEAVAELLPILAGGDSKPQSVALRLEQRLPEQHLLWLGVTHDCNLACRYCFVDLESCGRDMTSAIARQGIDRLVEASGERNRLQIIFFGGEPLLRMDLIREVVTYCRRLERDSEKRFAFNLTTNGLLLSDALFQELRELGVMVMVSLDGTREAHDRFRCTPEGEPTWDRIVANLRSIPDFGRQIAVRATLTAESSDYLGIFTTFEEMGFEQIYLTEVCPGPADSEQLREVDLRRLQAGYLVLMDYLLERARKTGDIKLAKMQRFLNALYSSHVSYYGCATGVGGYYLAPDGSYFPCNRMITKDRTFRLGDVEAGLAEEKCRTLLHNHVFNKRCRSCWARFLCGGQCYADSYWASGQISTPDHYSCAMIQFKIRSAAYYLARLQE